MLIFINIFNQASTLTINIITIFVNITKKLKQKVDKRLTENLGNWWPVFNLEVNLMIEKYIQPGIDKRFSSYMYYEQISIKNLLSNKQYNIDQLFN
ncbi:hypothetical protein OTSUT76_0283 [Orientia tsutsugamushi str. UT76]|uniref:Uncharacterized protein n=1 Tax=Orientia tsutsugamushi TaxID=784 RepID=A0A2U3QPW5_ORITS|nr:hypothetical protein OTSUT76_0283 [Orientia tsutsugamushi str. UT76]SPR02990.1 Uncharacterised protein [Orientia tsutsugamushi]